MSTDMRHADSAILMASLGHKLKNPKIAVNPQSSSTLSFAKSFQTVSQHATTKAAMLQADHHREKLTHDLEAGGPIVVDSCKTYLPLIHQILLTCKVQPELARLDQPLEFTWKSGLESKADPFYTSNAIMYDVVMTLAGEGLGHAELAQEAATAQDYAAASREYKAAASVFHSLATEHLPEWTTKCTTNPGEEALPVECSIPVAQAMAQLFKAKAQQMAIVSVLNKPDTPNYGLLAKLSWGVATELEKILKNLQGNNPQLVARLDPEIIANASFQAAFQKSLSMYCQARNQWTSKAEYGIAIALLKRSLTETKALRQAAPMIAKAHSKEISSFRQHVEQLLQAYENENATIYFATVPVTAQALQKFEEAVLMGKEESYPMPNVDPLPLMLPAPPKVDQSKEHKGMFSRIAKIAKLRS